MSRQQRHEPRPGGALSAMLAGAVAGGAVAHALVLRRRLREARRDPLTGAWTRQAWTLEAQRRLAHAGGLVLLVDLDGFKAVNDTYGHAVGDAVLVAVVDRLRAWTGDVDLVGRLGGDELVALLPGEDAERLLPLHRRLQDPVTCAELSLRVGASIGVHLAARGSEVPASLAAADAAMYTAKAHGGGLCVSAAGGAHLVPGALVEGDQEPSIGRWRRHRRPATPGASTSHRPRRPASRWWIPRQREVAA